MRTGCTSYPWHATLTQETEAPTSAVAVTIVYNACAYKFSGANFCLCLIKEGPFCWDLDERKVSSSSDQFSCYTFWSFFLYVWRQIHEKNKNGQINIILYILCQSGSSRRRWGGEGLSSFFCASTMWNIKLLPFGYKICLNFDAVGVDVLFHKVANKSQTEDKKSFTLEAPSPHLFCHNQYSFIFKCCRLSEYCLLKQFLGFFLWKVPPIYWKILCAADTQKELEHSISSFFTSSWLLYCCITKLSEWTKGNKSSWKEILFSA